MYTKILTLRLTYRQAIVTIACLAANASTSSPTCQSRLELPAPLQLAAMNKGAEVSEADVNEAGGLVGGEVAGADVLRLRGPMSIQMPLLAVTVSTATHLSRQQLAFPYVRATAPPLDQLRVHHDVQLIPALQTGPLQEHGKVVQGEHNAEVLSVHGHSPAAALGRWIDDNTSRHKPSVT